MYAGKNQAESARFSLNRTIFLRRKAPLYRNPHVASTCSVMKRVDCAAAGRFEKKRLQGRHIPFRETKRKTVSENFQDCRT
jgi:hypothetical protein